MFEIDSQQFSKMTLASKFQEKRYVSCIDFSTNVEDKKCFSKFEGQINTKS